VWRALKATAAATLRDGVYLLPASAPTAPALWSIEQTVREGGAEAHMLVVSARDEAQEKTFRALFDRSEPYAELVQNVLAARSNIKKSAEPSLRRTLRDLEQQLFAIQANDFFPAKGGARAAAALQALRQEVERHLSPGEPTPRSTGISKRLAADFQGKTWATRKRPWVDRLATAWLIARFIDGAPRFVWIESPQRCPKKALGFDFDGAIFTHVGDKVTFEVVLHTFGLEDDLALERLGELVHYIDVGGIPIETAAGVEAVVRGLQAQHPTDDDALLAAALPVFDSLYVAMKAAQ
jgi:hypothetical protein